MVNLLTFGQPRVWLAVDLCHMGSGWLLCDTFARKDSSLSFLRVNLIWKDSQDCCGARKQMMLTQEEYFQSILMVEVSERIIGKGFKINVYLSQVQVFN